MTIPLYHAVAVSAPDPVAVFTRAQAVWNARVVPPYESFTIACASTFLANSCRSGTIVQFIVRLADGRTFAQTLTPDGHPGSVLLHGGYAIGPAGAPFGFYRRAPMQGATVAPLPPNLAADPIQTIAVVRATDRAYDIALIGTESIGSRTCYHLRLRPLRNPQQYPLRELWVDTTTYDVVRFVYLWPYNNTTADITYDFAPAGSEKIWSIVHVDARARREHVGEDLQNITFPQSVPDTDFVP